MMSFDQFVASQNQPQAQSEAPAASPPATAPAPMSFNDFVKQDQISAEVAKQAKYDQRIGSSILDNPVMSFASGLAASAADTVLGIGSSAAKIVGADKVSKYLDEKQQDVNQFEKDREAGGSPTAAKLGNVGGYATQIAASAPAKATLATAGAISGGATAFSQSKADTTLGRLKDTADGAVVGGATGYGLGKAGKELMILGKTVAPYAKNIAKGFAIAIKDASDYAEAVTKTVLDKVGGKFADSTADDFVSAAKKINTKIAETKDAKYAARDAAAGDTAIDKTNTLKYVNSLNEQVKQGATSADKTVLSEAKQIIGTADKPASTTTTRAISTKVPGGREMSSSINRPTGLLTSTGTTLTRGKTTTTTKTTTSLPKNDSTLTGSSQSMGIPRAHTILSSVRSKANEAARQGNSYLAKKYGELGDAIEADITDAVGKVGGKLKQLHDDATTYYRDTFLPTREEGMKDLLKDKFTTEAYLSNFAKRVLNNPQARKSLGVMGDDVQKIFISAHLNALMHSARDSVDPSKINVTAYSKALNAELQKYPELYNAVGKDIETLANVLSSKATASMGITQHSFGQAAAAGAVGTMIGGPGLGVAIAGAYFAKKAHFLHAAGKMINSESARELLQTARQLSPKADPIIREKLYGKIGAVFDTANKGLAVLEGKGLATDSKKAN